MTAGHPMLKIAADYPSQERACLAVVMNSKDDDGTLLVDINFEPAVVTLEEAAYLLKVTHKTVRRLLHEGKLERLDIEDLVRVTWSSLVAFVQSKGQLPA
jgi:excisionase family DNA binding protein